MSYCVKQYPGMGQPKNAPIITLTTSHGSFGEAQIDVFGRAARWHQESPQTRKVSAPEDDNGRASTAICWEDGFIALILVAEAVS